MAIDGQTFQSPQNCRTVKAAESAAANLALISLPQDTSTQEQLPVGPILIFLENFHTLFVITNLTITIYFYN